jgi:hypothetical protein
LHRPLVRQLRRCRLFQTNPPRTSPGASHATCQAARLATRAAADRRGVTRLQPHIHECPRHVGLCSNCGRIAATRPTKQRANNGGGH